jgi:carboxymethylenebutenolidase
MSVYFWENMLKKSILLLLCVLALVSTTWLHSCSAETSDSDIANRMAQGHQNDRPVATEVAMTEPAQPVTAETVDYATVDGETITGYFAQPEAVEEPLPGLIAIHEWWGLNDNIRAMTRRLAGEGYAVLAVDLYGGETAQSPENARQLMQQVMQNPEVAETNLKQAYEYLNSDRNAPAIGSIGWCFGGGWSLRTALMYPEKLDAAVIYYGELVTDRERLDKLEMPILGIFGGQDQVIPVENVQEFESVLNSLGKTVEVHVYEEAGHAFANPSGDRYIPEAAADAWEETTAFLREYLQ